MKISTLYFLSYIYICYFKYFCQEICLRIFRSTLYNAMASKRKAHEFLQINPQSARRLVALRHTSVGQAAHAAIALSSLDAAEGDDVYQQTLKSIKNAAASECRKCKETMVLPLEVGGQTVYFTKLDKLFQRYCDMSAVFRDLMQQSLHQRREPLSLLLYLDETTAGNPLNPVNGKKSWLMYVTVMEFNRHLQKEEFWLVAGILKHEKVSLIPGGMSEVVKEMLAYWYNQGILNPSGFSLDINSEATLVRFKLHGCISDEAAMKSILDCKGASGMKPCCKCSNVISKFHGKKLNLQANDLLTDITETDPGKFLQQTDDDIFHILQKLQAAHDTETQGEAERLQQIYGWNWTETSLLACPLTRTILPPSACVFDWLHILFSNGVACVEISLLWEQMLASTPFCLQDLQDFALAGLQFRKSVHLSSYGIAKLFDEKLMEKASYAGDANQTVLALFIIEIFVEKVGGDLPDALVPYLDSFRKLCSLSRWKAGKCKAMTSLSGFMEAKISAHLCAFQHCYGKSKVRPKHHFSFHAAQISQMTKQLLDCWVTERKHRVYKDVAKMYAGNASFEGSVLTKLLMVQEHQVSILRKEPYIDKGASDAVIAAQIGAFRVVSGSSIRYRCETISVGDLFLMDNQKGLGGRVASCLAVDWGNKQECMLLVDSMTESLEGPDDAWHLSQWSFNEKKSLLNLSVHQDHMLWPLFWWKTADDRLCVSC